MTKKTKKIISLFNQSGGVGKSTLTMNLGYSLSLNHKVLVIDFDPQGSLSLFMGLEPSELTATIYDSLIDDEPLPIHSFNNENLHLVPSNIKLSGAELELVTADMRDLRLVDTVSTVQDDYDFILIDCPPSLGILSYISLVASTHILVPIQTQYKSFCGTELLLSTVARVKKRANRDLQILGFVPTMFAKSNSQDNRAVEAIKEQLADIAPVFDPIPRSTAFADAVENHLPLYQHSPKHPALKPLNDLVNFISE
jgi:chromosome partitioning protein